MGRTNLVILGGGLVAILAMSMLMQRLLKVHHEREGGAVALAVTEAYGNRLDGECAFKVEERPAQKGGIQQVGVLWIQPKLRTAGPRLATDIGRFIWRNHSKDRFQALEVWCRLGPKDEGQCHKIAKPYMSGSRKPTASGSQKPTTSGSQKPATSGSQMPAKKPATSAKPSPR